jgi:hypothetical protein
MDVYGLAIVWSTDKHVSIAAVRYLYDGVYHWTMAGLSTDWLGSGGKPGPRW